MALSDPLDQYLSAGIAQKDAERLTAAAPIAGGALDADWAALRTWLAPRSDALARLPRKPSRNPAEALAAALLLEGGRGAKEAFLLRHAAAAYDRLTLAGGRRRLLRLGDLAWAAAREFPGLVPSRAEVVRERELPQMHQDGLQVDQGIFLAHVLSDRERGLHLLHAMRQPGVAALDRLASFRESGRAELPSMTLERRDGLGRITFHHQAWLNAEDDEYQEAFETLVDLALLDDGIRVVVLRGAPMTKRAYAGRRIFGAGINLTKLYEGQISLLRFMLERETGPLAKIYRGLAREDFHPDAPEDGLEKPFIGAVDGFAIGGHCQVLLILDHVIAERGAYFNLPARKEGIIPGLANLRLPRFMGERAASQGIFFNCDFPADSPQGRLLCDAVVDGESEMEPAVERAAAELLSAGTRGFVANRRALRVGAEPIDLFRQYMAMYCREQAYCLYSPLLIDNLVRNWKARKRTG
ncbi:MAG TPA: enoyl-CoA hydratase/isomerase family protein [Myxococcales bacterium]|nr:enoyl-CoA hydratase/isomerase family protein [Myxococcales bacterium]